MLRLHLTLMVALLALPIACAESPPPEGIAPPPDTLLDDAGDTAKRDTHQHPSGREDVADSADSPDGTPPAEAAQGAGDTKATDTAPDDEDTSPDAGAGDVFVAPPIPATCNGLEALCGRRFDQVAYVTAHNAMANEEDGWGAPNQLESIPNQLAGGVRALMLDVHDWEYAPYPDDAYLCHGICLIGNERLADGLAKIERFLRHHRGEVVTIILENYVASERIAAAFEESDLIRYVYAHLPDEPWPTLGELIDRDERLVVFTDRHGGDYPWLMDVWQHAWETHWSAATLDDFSCRRNRGQEGNALFILNHFLTNPLALPELAEQANDHEVLLVRALECLEESGQLPNFVTVDFTSIGNVFEVVDFLNDQFERDLPPNDPPLPPTPACDPDELAGRCCCAHGTSFLHCTEDEEWECPTPLGWLEGAICETETCGGPCGPPCPNHCDAPDTDPGCPGGSVEIADGLCKPAGCVSDDIDDGYCTWTPLVGGPQYTDYCNEVSRGWGDPIVVCCSDNPHSMRGLYRTGNAGRCWERIDPDQYPFINRSDLQIRHVPGLTPTALVFADKVYRTTDAGLSFTEVAPFSIPRRPLIAIHPDGYIYALGVSSGGRTLNLWYSTDRGATFAEVPDLTTADPNQLAVNPSEPHDAILTGRFRGRFGLTQPALLTTNAADSFKAVGPVIETDEEGQAVAFAPSLPERMYLSVTGRGLFRSDNRGGGFTLVTDEHAPSAIRVHPEDPDRLYFPGARLTSRDAGVTLQEASDEEVAEFLPDPRVCGNDGRCDLWVGGGLFRSNLRFAADDEPLRPAMSGLPFGTCGFEWLIHHPFVPLGDESALVLVRVNQMIVF